MKWVDEKVNGARVKNRIVVNNGGNSSQHWNYLWTRKLTNSHIRIPLSHKVEKFIRNHLYLKAIDMLLGAISLVDKKIIELGCGTGSNSLYLARTRKVSSVTLLDFSHSALTRVVSELYPCPVTKICANLLEFSPKAGYDFVHSTGVVEHFLGTERVWAIEKHSECVRVGGFVMIWVPVFSHAFRYIGKFNRWIGIEELPFTKKELQSLCLKNKLEIIREGESGFGALYGILCKKIG